MFATLVSFLINDLLLLIGCFDCRSPYQCASLSFFLRARLNGHVFFLHCFARLLRHTLGRLQQLPLLCNCFVLVAHALFELHLAELLAQILVEPRSLLVRESLHCPYDESRTKGGPGLQLDLVLRVEVIVLRADQAERFRLLKAFLGLRGAAKAVGVHGGLRQTGVLARQVDVRGRYDDCCCVRGNLLLAS